MWTLEDYTNEKTGGYLRINRDGRRVVDAFPYARDADEQWVRAQAQRIVDAMNDVDAPLGRGDTVAASAPR